uniref:Uncharacterized protein n=1 Tax=Picea glauca TaxID=3330 RepID=A0A124GNC3_PICGL|nr:hypothetical protein ABT39_MTgene5382 [Picea glauca]
MPPSPSPDLHAQNQSHSHQCRSDLPIIAGATHLTPYQMHQPDTQQRAAKQQSHHIVHLVHDNKQPSISVPSFGLECPPFSV